MTNLPMPELIDSHCHLHSIDLSEFDNNMQVLLDKARDVGVQRMLCVSIELDDVTELRKLAAQYPNIYISAGVHPNSETPQELDVNSLVALADHPACIAIGETGLDYYRTPEEHLKEMQRQRFRAHIQAAIHTGKPLIIHTRAAVDDTISLMQDENASEIGGVLHCFTETWEMAKDALDLGFYISFSGIVTFKNATQLQEVVKKVPLDRILIETDSPYLAPVPFRGKQNHPALVKQVAEALCALKNVKYDKLAEQTTQNFYKCFRTCRHENA